MFERLNQQQQPFIQSGYGAMGRLNTLLGLGAPRSPGAGSTGEIPLGDGMTLMPSYRPRSGGAVRQIVSGDYEQTMPDKQIPRDPSANYMQPMGNLRLRQLLALRAAHGDTEAARIMESL